MRRCVIFGGGELKDIRFTQSLLREDDYIVCADRGYAYCAAMGRKPDLILGDFDSYNGKLPPGCEVLRYPIEKDDTAKAAKDAGEPLRAASVIFRAAGALERARSLAEPVPYR